jgi:hypothetical protein
VDAKIGDRVSFDAKKVGQARRVGVIKEVTKGLSGSRYQVSWDDGTASIISPSGGTLTIEGRARSSNGKNGKKDKSKAKKKR